MIANASEKGLNVIAGAARFGDQRDGLRAAAMRAITADYK